MDVSRYVKDKDKNIELKFTVEFVTPCFLGGADGNAEIRVAPFKNLIRRWWRIVNGNLLPKELWQKESELFGSTEKMPETNKTFGKSKVELRIVDTTKVSYLTIKPNIEKFHKKTKKGTIPVDTAMYLGYGAITNKGTKKYIKADSKCDFLLTCDKQYEKEIVKTLFYINLFGTIGSKSKNGFGSISISGIKFNPAECWPSLMDYQRVLKDGRNYHYPHAIVKDEKGCLAWQTKDALDWEEVMKALCDIYLQSKVRLKEAGKIQKSDWQNLLGYATQDSRLPSQIILKVAKRPKKDNQQRYYGMVIHIPYAIDNWKKGLKDQIEANCYLTATFDYQSDILSGCYGRNLGGSK